MAKFADRVKVGNTTAANAGSATTLTLGSAEAGYQAVPSSLDGETIRYVIEEGNTWEIGTGTYTHSGTTLTRSVTSSSNSNNAIAVTTNSKVFIAPVVDDLQFVQVYSSTSDLPSASSNHGRITHVHGEGAMYFAHGGSWIKLANASDAISLTDLSVTQNAASGSGALTYNSSTGVFSYTPPTSTSASGGTLDPVKETEFTATANQTTFTVTYAVGNIAVFLNGSKLGAADFTATNGTSVILATGATANDLVEVVEYGAPFASPYSSSIHTATANQTSLTVAYTVDKVAVYVNGVKYLVGTDVTATNGTSLTFTSALSAGDKIEVVEHGALADAASAFTDLTDTPSSLGSAGQVVQVNSAGNALEFADASSGVSVYTGLSGTDGTPSGATYLLNASSSAGDLAYVTANTGLYQNNGNGWYKIATINTSPAIGSVSETTSGSTTTLTDNGTFTLTAGANTVVTITASDTDPGTDLTYTHTVTSGTASNVATITQGTGASENVFTLAPATSVGGTITVRFDVTDNTNTAQFTNSFSLSFVPSWDQHASTMRTSWPTTIYTDTVSLGQKCGGLWFNSTGTKMVLSNSAGASSNSVGRLKEYTLNPAWDHTSATFSQDGDSNIYANSGFTLTGNGMTVVYGDSTDQVKYTNLTSAFDTSSRNGTRQNGPQVTMTVRDVKFSYDGSKLFVLHGTTNTNTQLWTYDLSTNYDISSTSATRDSSNTFTPYSSWNEARDIFSFQFNPKGTRLYMMGTYFHNFTSWPLTSAWDLTSAGSYTEGMNLGVSDIRRFFIRPDTGDEIYISDDTTGTSQVISSRRDS